MKKLLLLDTSATFHRSYNAIHRATGGMVTTSGIPVTGTYGVLNNLFSLLSNENYESIIPCYDAGSNWRKQESETYKGTRQSKDIEFYADLGLLLEEVFPSLGMNPCGKKGWEADDIIATIARNSPAYGEIHIWTCDKDFLQLVSKKVKVVLFSSSKKVKTYGIDEVLEETGVLPSEVAVWKSLRGDSSDNVAGIKGIGPVTAVKIIQEVKETYKDAEDFTLADKVCLHPKVGPSAGVFLANLRLVTLEADVENIAWFSSSVPNPEAVLKVFETLEFASFTKRKGKILKALGCRE